WYFIAPARQGAGFTGTVGFRARGAVEIRYPDTGRTERAQVTANANGHTWVSLSLAPHEACFVVFRKVAQQLPAVARVLRDNVTVMEASGRFAENPPAIWATVVEARYGNLVQEGKWRDVRKVLQDALDRGLPTVRVNNDWAGGDPARQTLKSFSARIRLADGREVTLSGRENTTVVLPTGDGEAKRLPCESFGAGLVAWTNGTYRIVRTDGSVTERTVENAGRLHLHGTWNVRYPEGWGMPSNMQIQTLVPWREVNGTMEGRAFSGTVEYAIDFNVDKLDADSMVMLDLGRVESLARV
ncbi:MAG: hypothetical protein J6334_01920, partial [Kiritimatiellae bacterium]|nr:hypothetical protein [Kiritimatiellia bacterium]